MESVKNLSAQQKQKPNERKKNDRVSDSKVEPCDGEIPSQGCHVSGDNPESQRFTGTRQGNEQARRVTVSR